MAFPYHRQETYYSCVAASMRMVLEFFGIKKSEKEVIKLVKSTPDYGTWFKDFAIAAKKIKLNYVEKENGKISEMRQLILKKYKLIICYLDLNDKEHGYVIDHYSVVKKNR